MCRVWRVVLCNLISGWECYDYGSSIDQLLHRLHVGTQAPLQLQVITHLAVQLVGAWFFCNLISGWECYGYKSSIDQLLHRLHDGTQAPLQLQDITHLAVQLARRHLQDGSWATISVPSSPWAHLLEQDLRVLRA